MPDLPSIRSTLDEADPNDRLPRLVMAEAFDTEDTTDPRGTVLRAACAIHEQIGNVVLPDRFAGFWTESPGWEAAGRRLEEMSTRPDDTKAFRDRYGRLIRGDVPLDPEDLEATLRLQYDRQVSLLRTLGLLLERGDQVGITAVDGKHYPLPTFEEVLAKLQRPELQDKLTQGFDTLLLVPFGLPLERLLDAWRDGMRRNEDILRAAGRRDERDPLNVWGEYTIEPLVYDPATFTGTQGGHARSGYTKEQLLGSEGRGWDTLLVEGAMDNLPYAGEAQVVGGRTQFPCGGSADEYLAELRARGEVGLTPEAYAIFFLDALQRRGQVPDTDAFSFLVGAYFAHSRLVPRAVWVPQSGQVYLGGDLADDRSHDGGVRAAVRVA